jgi:hypothetical protein
MNKMNKLNWEIKETEIRKQRIEEWKSTIQSYIKDLEACQIINGKKNLIIDLSQDGFSLQKECPLEDMLDSSDEYLEKFFSEILEKFPIFINDRVIKIRLDIVDRKDILSLEQDDTSVMKLINMRASKVLN